MSATHRPPFPGNHIKLFNNLLARTKLKFDRDGKPRTAYSLRHTYICMRLMEGADIYQIAKNCRTSVEMIEKHYAVHLKNTLDASAINVLRPKPDFRKKKFERRDLRSSLKKKCRSDFPNRLAVRRRAPCGQRLWGLGPPSSALGLLESCTNVLHMSGRSKPMVVRPA